MKEKVTIFLLTFLFFCTFFDQSKSFGEKLLQPKDRSFFTKKIIIGIARHDENMKEYLKPNIKLEKIDNYFGKAIGIRTFFTTIFEPWEKTSQFILKIKDQNQLPSLTLEFRSWAQLLNDPGKIRAERAWIDKQFGNGYYDLLMSHIRNETVLTGIIQGDFDLILNFYAKNLSSLGNINLRLFHEPFWFPWKMHNFDDHKKFIKAVQHVHQILENNMAQNVHIVVTFDVSGFDVEEVILQALLPDKIIKVIEIDGYNDAWRRGLWKNDPGIKEMFGPKVKKINAILNSLPKDQSRPIFVIGETAFDGTGILSKKLMYQNLVNFVKENKIDGIIFLDENDGPIFEGKNGWHVDWTMEESWAKEILDQISP